MANVFILDGHCSAALAFVRSLGRAGHYIVVGAQKEYFTPAVYSRYCKSSCHYPSPVQGVRAFLDSIVETASRESIDIIFPMTDITVWPLARWRQHFEKSIIVAAPSHKSIEFVSDKYKIVQLAESLRIPVPETILVEAESALPAPDWPYPVVIKDRFSMKWNEEGKGISGGVQFAYSEKELHEKIIQRTQKTGEVIVQKFSTGVGIGFSCFNTTERMFLPFQWQRIREKDPRGSGSSARKSCVLDPEILAFSRKLIDKTGFHGLSMVEWKKDFKTGNVHLMEINGRPWGSMQLPIHCGYDYPKILADWLLFGKLPQHVPDYKKNITCRWLVADLLHLENLKEGKPHAWPDEYPGLFASILKVGIPWYPGLHYDHLSWRDPKPGLAELFKWFKDRFTGAG